jgi:hypothetical protein
MAQGSHKKGGPTNEGPHAKEDPNKRSSKHKGFNALDADPLEWGPLALGPLKWGLPLKEGGNYKRANL